MSNVKTLINGTVLTMDREDTIYESGYVTVENNTIVGVGPMADCVPRGKVYDLSGKVIMPGFINTHTHTPSPLFRGMADDLKLMDWLQKVIWPGERHLEGEMVYWGTALSCLEFLEGGITTFADQYFFAEKVAEAVQASGLRALIGATVFTDPSPETDDTLQAAADFIGKYKGKEAMSRIYPCLGPHAPYSCSEATLQETSRLARDYDVLVHTHISETREENERILAATGYTPVKYLEKVGLLDNPVLAAHCVHLEEEDMLIMKEHGVAVSYNPISNLKLVSGIMPLKRLWDRGIVVSIGTDGAQSNNSLDLLRDLKTGVLIQKQQENDAAFFTVGEALRMLTIEGARAVGLADKIGSLEAGKLADITVLDLLSTNLQPIHPGLRANLYSQVVYAAHSANVVHVMVDGEFLLYNRQPLRINKEEVLEQSGRAATALMSKAGLLP